MNKEIYIKKKKDEKYINFEFKIKHLLILDKNGYLLINSSISEYSKSLNESCGKPYYIDISLGVHTFTCSQMLSIEEVLHFADEALYEQKKNKRKSVVKGAL